MLWLIRHGDCVWLGRGGEEAAICLVARGVDGVSERALAELACLLPYFARRPVLADEMEERKGLDNKRFGVFSWGSFLYSGTRW